MINFKTITVAFTPSAGRTYDYFASGDSNIVSGDTVLVYSRDAYSLASVVSVTDGLSDRATRPIVSKVDSSSVEYWRTF